jgi:hypothetical protein
MTDMELEIAQFARRIRDVHGVFDQVWCVVATGALISGLAFSGIGKHYYGVNVYPGSGIGDSLEQNWLNVTIIDHNESIEIEETRDPPPFSSNLNYDAKAWSHVIAAHRKNPNDRILFWNVAANYVTTQRQDFWKSHDEFETIAPKTTTESKPAGPGVSKVDAPRKTIEKNPHKKVVLKKEEEKSSESETDEHSSVDLDSLLLETIPEGLTEMPLVMTPDQLRDWLIQSNARDGSGELDWNDIRGIVGYADIWKLQNIDLKNLPDVELEPIGEPRKNPIVVGFSDGIYEVFDGMHRIGEANWRGDKTIRGYVGESFQSTPDDDDNLNSNGKNVVPEKVEPKKVSRTPKKTIEKVNPTTTTTTVIKIGDDEIDTNCIRKNGYPVGQLIDCGDFGCVLSSTSNTVVKVGWIQPFEVKLQIFASTLNVSPEVFNLFSCPTEDGRNMGVIVMRKLGRSLGDRFREVAGPVGNSTDIEKLYELAEICLLEGLAHDDLHGSNLLEVVDSNDTRIGWNVIDWGETGTNLWYKNYKRKNLIDFNRESEIEEATEMILDEWKDIFSKYTEDTRPIEYLKQLAIERKSEIKLISETLEQFDYTSYIRSRIMVGRTPTENLSIESEIAKFVSLLNKDEKF